MGDRSDNSITISFTPVVTRALWEENVVEAIFLFSSDRHRLLSCFFFFANAQKGPIGYIACRKNFFSSASIITSPPSPNNYFITADTSSSFCWNGLLIKKNNDVTLFTPEVSYGRYYCTTSEYHTPPPPPTATATTRRKIRRTYLLSLLGRLRE